MLRYVHFTNVYMKSVNPCCLKSPQLALGLSCKIGEGADLHRRVALQIAMADRQS
jgi:hypothetical protein